MALCIFWTPDSLLSRPRRSPLTGMELMLELLFDLLGTALLRPLAWGIALPISWVIATPVILVLALFQSETYSRNVQAGYLAVYEFWERLLMHAG